MVNLKSFTWDMPRRLKADVWSALSSSAHSRLQGVWVRFHENFRNYWNDLSNTNAPQNYNVEYPTLSILPPVKGLTVLAIDQASYLEELAVLIERSRDWLRALRIGLGWHVEQEHIQSHQRIPLTLHQNSLSLVASWKSSQGHFRTMYCKNWTRHLNLCHQVPLRMPS